MKGFPAIAIIVTAGFCQANPANLENLANSSSEASSSCYRCPVEDKFLNGGDFFDYLRNINSWQKCGKICKKTKGDGDGNGYCSFWSFYRGTCYLYPAGADKYQKSVPGAVSGERGCRK